MTQHALVRARRFQAKEPTLRLLTFQLRDQWFCLPLAMARRVLPRQPASDGGETGLIYLQNENIPILDTAMLVYGPHPQRQLAQVEATDRDRPSHPAINTYVQSIVVIDLEQAGAIGLLVDGTPVLRRVRQSAFSPVPPVYLTVHKMNGVSSIVNGDSSAKDPCPQPMFLLSLENLLPQP